MKVRRCIAVALLSCLLQGCAYTYGIPQSHKYVHLPEYGYLPIHDRFIYADFVAYDINVDLSLPGTGIDNIQKLPRRMLPQTLNEAKSIVAKNLENLEPINQRRRSEMTASIPGAIVKTPFALLYWFPVIGGVIQQFDPPTSVKKPDVLSSPQASETKARKQLPQPNIGANRSLVTQVAVDVSGPRGEKVPDAAVYCFYRHLYTAPTQTIADVAPIQGEASTGFISLSRSQVRLRSTWIQAPRHLQTGRTDLVGLLPRS